MAVGSVFELNDCSVVGSPSVIESAPNPRTPAKEDGEKGTEEGRGPFG
jgi:hypothetical protein